MGGSTSDMLPGVAERSRVVGGVANAELFLDAHYYNNNVRQYHFQVLQANPYLYRQAVILRTR